MSIDEEQKLANGLKIRLDIVDNRFMSEIINYTRLTTSDKLEDRFLTCQVYQPIDPEQAESGMVFSQIEIMNPWFPTSQIGQTIINTLIREYYRGSDTSELVNFENAVKKVNEALAQIAQNGETDWIGKLSGVLVLYNNNEIHFAQTGNSQAYLYRGTKINHITEGLDPEEAPHPLKTFTNITSGTLEKDDKIAVANSAFFETIKPLELRRIITSFNPTLTAIETAKILKMNASRVGNAIFLELTTKEELANLPPDQKIEAIYLDQSGANLGIQVKSFYTSTLRPFLSKLLKSFGILSQKAAETAGPHLKRGLKAAKTGTLSAYEKISKSRKTTEPAEKKDDPSPFIEGNSQPVIDRTSSKFEVRQLYLKFKNKLRRFLIRLGFYSPQKSKMILPILIAVVLVFALILGFSFYLRSRGSSDKQNQDKANQVTSLSNEAIINETRGDETAALNDYKQIVAIANGLKGTKYESQVTSAFSAAQNKIQEITKMKTLNSQKTITLDPDVISITTAGDSLVTVLKTGELRQAKSPATTFTALAKVKLPSDQIVSSTYLKDTDTIAFIFSNKALATFNIQTKEWQNEPVKITYAGNLANFGDTIYVLDPPDNQIWKDVSDQGAYNAQTPYLKETGANVSDAIGLAIDGSVYALSNTGAITKFSKGTKSSDFKIELPAGEQLSSWAGLFTSENSNSIIALANESGLIRIAQLNKSGSFIGQFELNGVSTPDRVLIDSESQKVYAQKGEQVFEFSF